MTTLITGGAGFIGYHLAQALLRRSERVVVVDNFNTFYDPALKRKNVSDLCAQGKLEVHEADILDSALLRQLFERHRPDAVVHLAAWAGVRPSLDRPALYSDVNVTGTVNVLELARDFGVGCLVFGSSSSVYGGNTKVPFSETDSVDRPVSPYAATKKAGELLCHTYAHNYGLPITCLRFFTVYGPRQRPEMAIHKFARLICEGRPVPVFGDGSSRRDYTYVDDIVSGVLGALERRHAFSIFNLGESQTTTLLDLVRLLEEALGKKADLHFLPEQPGDMEITYADIRLARENLGYAPQVKIAEGIRRFAAWFLDARKTA